MSIAMPGSRAAARGPWVRSTHLVASLALLTALLGPAAAQAPAGPAASAARPAPASTAKATKPELVARIVQLQQGQVQAAARAIVEQPAIQLAQQAAIAIQQRLPPDQREAAGKDVQAEVRKYFEDASPIMRDAVQRLAAQTMAPLFEERFNEDELRQLIAIFESPVLRKYDLLAPELQKALREKFLAETRGRLEERYRALDLAVARRIGIAPPAGAASGAAAGPAAAGSGTRKP